MHVTLLGTGVMGTGMAGSLLRSGHVVTVWNRSRGKAEPLSAAGATVADDPATAVAHAEVVLTILYDAGSVQEVMGQALPAMRDGAVWVQSSTVGVDGTRELAGLAAAAGVPFVDAPVLGTRQPAEKGQLVVLAAAAESLQAAVGPVFDAIGSRTMWVSEQPGDASALKLAVNAWIGSITAAAGQSVALARALGLDPRLFLEAIGGGPVDSPYAQVKGSAMITGDFPPSFALDGVVKDLGLIADAAASVDVATTLVDAVRACFVVASDRGHGAEDMAAVVAAFAR